MKTSHDNSQLDNFLRDALKNLDVQYQQSDWSDMESLLGPAQKPVDLKVNKKTILISASALAIIIIGIIISQTVHFNNSPPEEIPPQNMNSSQSLLNAADTQKTTVAAPVIDSAKTGPALIEENKIADSVKTAASPDTNKEKNSVAKIIPKQDKKQKQNNAKIPAADTSSAKTPAELPAVDTASKHPLPETIPASPEDTSKKNKKDKKSKLKFLFRQKPDSLR